MIRINYDDLRYVYLVKGNDIWMEMYSVRTGLCIEGRHERFNDGFIEIDKNKYKGRTRDMYFLGWHHLYDEVVKMGRISQEQFISVMDKLGFEQVDEL